MSDHTPQPVPADSIGRRRFLVIGGAAAVGAAAIATRGVGLGSAAASTPATSMAGTEPAGSVGGSVASSLSTGTPVDTVFTAADFSALGACRVLPDLTQGPYPTTEQIERRDITEGRAGLALRVGVQVVDETCSPIPGAIVEIWHCDIDGDYSAYADGFTTDDAGEGTTFLRGFQVANDEGIVEFLTLYPGWYTGRAVHIHSKVHLDDTTVLTTQYLFDDALNSEVLAQEPYAPFGEPDTTNETDGVTGGTAADSGLLFTVTDDSAISGKRALIVVGVDPDATSSGAAGGEMGDGGSVPGGPGGPGAGSPPDGIPAPETSSP